MPSSYIYIGVILISTRQVTNAVFLGEAPPIGFGFSQIAIAGAYGTPIVKLIFSA
jgi:hypothetical protein